MKKSLFFSCFKFSTGFYHCFQVLSLLMAFVYLTNLTDFHQCFFRCFLFHYRFLLLLFSCFHFTLTVFLSGTWLLCCYATNAKDLGVLWAFFALHPFPHLPQNRECYRFERAFLTLRRFLPYIPSRHLAQPSFIKAFLGAGSSSLKVAGPPTKVRNTHPAHLFV